VIDGRDEAALQATATAIGAIAAPGDITDPVHRVGLLDRSRLDLLVNNAGTLGASPLPPLGRYPLDSLRVLMESNVIAPLALIQLALPLLARSCGAVVNVTSDAAVEAYEGWGGYGASKAALDRLTAVLAAENGDVTFWSLDPGDMRTRMHQEAFPGEDITDRPEPETIAPVVLRLIEERRASGRVRAAELLSPR
jgi:NAD(P)-dependent dehydrogenase (short-subunit alcohol dehydrogenase family)